MAVFPELAGAGIFNYPREVIAENLYGYGARQMAMGGVGIMSMDGMALYYNPANLARIPRIELNLGLSYQKFTDEGITSAFGLSSAPVFSAKDDKTNTRLNSAVLTVPYPTYRGSLVFGFGVARVADFDRLTTFDYQEDYEMALEVLESGGLYEWSAGLGIDLSPRISFGGSLSFYHGRHESNSEYEVYSSGTVLRQEQEIIEDKYLGLGARVGLAMQLSRYVGLGITVESPVSFNVENNGSYSVNYADPGYYETVEYDIKRPFTFATGLITRLNNTSLFLDLKYIDWTQLSYGDNSAMEQDNDLFNRFYRETLSFRLGGEYTFPEMGLSLRAGYFNVPLPYENDATYDPGRRDGFTFGLGFLVDQVLMIDVAYVSAGYTSDIILTPQGDIGDYFDNDIAFSEDASLRRIYITGAYRF